MAYRFTADLWEYDGPGTWHFVTLPFEEADEIDELTRTTQRGFGSVRVRVTVGATTWATSLFPATKVSSYVLPMKQQVRRAEGLRAGAPVDVTLELVDHPGPTGTPSGEA